MNATIIQEDLTIQGNLTAESGAVSIGGSDTGDIDAKAIEILSGAKVTDGIAAEEVKISGSLDRSVKCDRLALDEKSMVPVDVSAKNVTISPGTKISGHVKVGGS